MSNKRKEYRQPPPKDIDIDDTPTHLFLTSTTTTTTSTTTTNRSNNNDGVNEVSDTLKDIDDYISKRQRLNTRDDTIGSSKSPSRTTTSSTITYDDTINSGFDDDNSNGIITPTTNTNNGRVVATMNNTMNPLVGDLGNQDFDFDLAKTDEDYLYFSINKLVNVDFERDKYKQSPKFVLQSILYDEMKDNSMVDKHLLVLKRSGKIRVIKLLSGHNDYLILKTDDYIEKINSLKSIDNQNNSNSSSNNNNNVNINDINIPSVKGITTPQKLLIQKRLQSLQNQTQPSQQLTLNQVLDRFITKLIPKFTDTSIFKSKIQQLMDLTPQQTDNAITMLVQSNLLLINSNDGSYLFTIPGSGAYITDLVKGRKEFISILKKQKYKELLLSELLKKKLRYSNMSMVTLIRDLKVAGEIKSLQTTAGELIRYTPLPDK